MGLHKHHLSSSSFDRCPCCKRFGYACDCGEYDSLWAIGTVPSRDDSSDCSPNPDPARYKIVKSKEVSPYLILFINYPDCENYEGNKILLFKDVTMDHLLEQKLIDPHFSDAKDKFSPTARFVPSEDGWWMAEMFVDLMLHGRL